MKLQQDTNPGQYSFTAYGEGFVSVNHKRHTSNVIVLHNRITAEWTTNRFEELEIKDFELMAQLNVDVVLLGTGPTLRFPPPELLQPFMEARKGIEFMDVFAACRTYNVLLSEGRSVAACILIA